MSPALLDQYGVPSAPADLAVLPSLDFGPPYGEHVWQLEGPAGSAAVRHTPRFITDDMIALRQAAVAGAGVVQLPLMMVCDELASGALVKVIPAWLPKSGIIHAVFPSRRGLLPSVRKLIDFLAARFAQIEET